ncbi:MAG: hypothetical protein IT304_10365, partial [Dehalococcoidia bacterium]|nr:hypothetical protein [Dehalococcoidia bacterium]
SGKSNDLRYVGFGQNIPFLAARLLEEIGESPAIPTGETSPRLERIIEGLEQTVSGVVLPELHSLVARTQARTIPLLFAGVAARLTAPAPLPNPPTADEIEARALAPR